MSKKIKTFIQSRLSNPFWKNVATLFSGTAIAQVIPLAILPILTRLYPKEQIGFYFVFLSVGLLTQVIASLQYHFAIILPKKDNDAQQILWLNFGIIGIMTLVITAAVHLLGPIILNYTELNISKEYMYCIPASAFFLGSIESIISFFNRNEDYSSIAYSKIIRSITQAVIQLLLALLAYHQYGLIIGLLTGQACGVLFLIYKLLRHHHFTAKPKITKMLILLKQYRDIPLYNTLISLMSTLSGHLPIFLFTNLYTPVTTSEFGLAHRTIGLPMGFMEQSVGQVFYQQLSVTIKNKAFHKVPELVITTYKRLFKTGVVPFLLITISAPFLFPLIFSNEYASSGIFTSIVTPMLFIQFLNAPITYLITTLNKQRVMLFYNLALLICRAAAIILTAHLFNNPIHSVLAYSIIGLLFGIGLCLYLIRLSKNASSVRAYVQNQ